jgi:serine/threonine protein kinase
MSVDPQFNSLKRCDTSCEVLAKEIDVPISFIIEQSRVVIDTVSGFGHGAFAKIIRAKYHGANVRIKRIHAILSQEERLLSHRFLQECRLASHLRHPNIVHFYGVVMDGRLPMLAMEELVCSLYDFIDKPENILEYLCVPNFKTSSTGDKVSDPDKSISPNPRQHNGIVFNGAEAADDAIGAQGEVNRQNSNIKMHQKIIIALEIVQGLAYLHTKKPYPIVHRDLSSGNVLLGVFARKIVTKIADFGQCKEIKTKGDWSSRCPGTIAYLPPEVLPLPDDTGTDHQRDDRALQPPPEMRSVPIVRNQSHQSRVVGNPERSIVHLTQEPGSVQRTWSSSLEGAVKPSNPPLKTSIDMYMYGVLCLELLSEQHPHTWKVSSKVSWHMSHEEKLKTIPNGELLYGIAKHCIIDNPDLRAKADDLVQSITKQMVSRSSRSAAAAPVPNEVSQYESLL